MAIASDGDRVQTVDRADAQITHFVDMQELGAVSRIKLPTVEILPDALGRGITPEQGELVANHGLRVLCNRLAPYFEIVGENDDPAGAADLRVVVTAIQPTSAAMAGLSGLIDVVVPGPARLPAGLGGLAAEAELRDSEGDQALVKAWARGANSVTNSAQVSAIGDAWQLAGSFGADLARLMIRSMPEGETRERVAEALREAGRAKCRAAFGSVNLGARGVSRLVPLPPESFDAGRPAPEELADIDDEDDVLFDWDGDEA